MNRSDYEQINAVVSGMDAMIAVHTDRRLELIPAEVELLRSWADRLRSTLTTDTTIHEGAWDQLARPEEFKCPFHKPKKVVG